MIVMCFTLGVETVPSVIDIQTHTVTSAMRQGQLSENSTRHTHS